MAKKTVLVSGGTRGIGKDAVLQLLKDGFRIATFSRDKEKCEALRKELVKQFAEADFLYLFSICKIRVPKAAGAASP